MAKNNGPAQDHSGVYLAFLAVVAAGIFALWHFHKNTISLIFVEWKSLQLWVTSLFSSEARELYLAALSKPLHEWTIGQLAAFGSYSSLFFSIAAAFALIGMCIDIWRRGLDRQFVRPLGYTLDSFMAYQSLHWCSILPVIRENPVEDKTGRWRSALNIREFIKEYAIGINTDGSLDRFRSYEILAAQLGRPWTRLSGLRPHEKALLAAFAIHGLGETKLAMGLLNELNHLWYRDGYKIGMDKALSSTVLGKNLLSRIEKVLRTEQYGGFVSSIGKRHAFVVTAFLGILKTARQMGVMTTPNFLWLKVENRPLFYALNNLGRYTFHIEGAAPMAHFGAEEAAKRRLIDPQIVAAVDELNDMYHREPPLDEARDMTPDPQWASEDYFDKLDPTVSEKADNIDPRQTMGSGKRAGAPGLLSRFIAGFRVRP